MCLGNLLGSADRAARPLRVVVFLAPRADRTGFLAIVALVPILLTMVVGSIGEAASPRSPDVPHPVQLWGDLIGAVAYLGLLVAVIWALHRRRWRPTKGRRVSPSSA